MHFNLLVLEVPRVLLLLQQLKLTYNMDNDNEGDGEGDKAVLAEHCRCFISSSPTSLDDEDFCLGCGSLRSEHTYFISSSARTG